ncbi:hypothetical protein [Shewanella woodyi]|uniref:hypothetical protein n=1 Tax=Shewanella woodyi TaxID=60961 RepID=UPI0007F96C3A|nr:hypothetical protein [Shewanella woodyi]
MFCYKPPKKSGNKGGIELLAAVVLISAMVTPSALGGGSAGLAGSIAHNHKLSIFDQKLSFTLPEDWKLAFSEKQNTMFSAEFTPVSDELRDWSSLFCVQGFKGLADSFSPETFLDSIAATYEESCTGEITYQKLGESDIDGYSGFTAIIGCSHMPNTHKATQFNAKSYSSDPKGEIGHYTAISGEQDMYLLHQSMRGEVFNAETPPLEPANYREFMATIAPYGLSR